MNHDSDSENVRRLWHGSPQQSGGANIIRCVWSFTLLTNVHDLLLAEQLITAAPVLTMSETRFLSSSVANMWLKKPHVSGSVVSFAAEHLLESCGSGRV